jgi:hypothetical protein
VYDMYHWHRIDAAADDAARHAPGTATSTAPRGAAPHTGGPGTGLSAPGGPAVQAVQVALDRRDNGGDLAATRGE